MTKFDILLVEDEAPKRQHIEQYLRQIAKNATVRISKSFNSAMDAIEEKTPNLMLLDMSLPTFDINQEEPGGRPQGFGGKEVMRFMTMAGLSCPVIVITGYEAFPRESGKMVDLDQFREELALEFPSMLLGVLHYNSTYDEWKTELSKSMMKFLGENEE